jgi:hypothetical protein
MQSLFGCPAVENTRVEAAVLRLSTINVRTLLRQDNIMSFIESFRCAGFIYSLKALIHMAIPPLHSDQIGLILLVSKTPNFEHLANQGRCLVMPNRYLPICLLDLDIWTV